MGYRCDDCSYLGDQAAADGSCPACGSLSFTGQSGRGDDADDGRHSKLRLALVVVLWAVLIYLVYDKLGA